MLWVLTACSKLFPAVVSAKLQINFGMTNLQCFHGIQNFITRTRKVERSRGICTSQRSH